MTYTPIKRGKYTLGDVWKGQDEREWEICRIAESDLGNVFKLRTIFETRVLSEYSMKEFLRYKVIKSPKLIVL